MISLLFGFTNSGLDFVSQKIGEFMQVPLECNDSAYRGGEYYCIELGDYRSIYVQKNADMDELAEEDYPNFNSLVYVDCFDNEQQAWIDMLSSESVGCTLLQRRER